MRLVVSATGVLETRELIATGRRCPVDSVTDLRGGPSIVGWELDHAYPEAASPALIRWPSRELAIAFDGPLRTLVVHTRPGSFCVEPQTAWPNAAALAARGVDGTGLTTLAPGTRLHGSMRWRWRSSFRDAAASGAALRTGRDAAAGA